MDSHIDMQSPPNNSPEQEQPNSIPTGASLVSPAVPQPSATPLPAPPPANDIDPIAKARTKERNNELRAVSRKFGSIPNVPIFTVWDSRQHCSDAAVHRSLMAGICGSSRDGAFSIALSSLYKDDEDRGDVIIYTGAGGRERWTSSFPPKRLRLGPQTKDQSWDHPSNKALVISSITGNPVRVIRSWRSPSQYAPANGYRYDGLYTITGCWSAKGHNGKKICRCRLERLPDQPPIPERPPTLSASRRRRRERLVSACNIPDAAPHQRDPPQQEAMSNASEIDFDIGEVDFDMKEDTQPPPPRTRVTSNPDALPRYRWDSRKKQLVKVSGSHPNPEVGGCNEEGYRGEDDAVTLVPSEDDHADVVAERAATEYFSDRGNSPRFETPDEPRPSGSSAVGDPKVIFGN